ncbi:MAG: tetratricopeptide repeat protein [Bacteroidales bacterium]|jgi:outer membrane protein assembly factor BamD (BamD/ComL family)|nr:tetratricopeptide repeat protein [Bacteroidales bacterium]
MKRYILLIATLVTMSCGNKTDNKPVEIKDAKAELMKTISQTEATALQATKSIDPILADSLMRLYDRFTTLYPQDTLCPFMMSKAVDVAANTKNCVRALEFLERITDKYHNNTYVEWAYFYKGTVYADVCGDKDKALEAYGFFLDNYPQSSFAQDATVLLNMLKLNDEMQLIREFEAKNSEQ